MPALAAEANELLQEKERLDAQLKKARASQPAAPVTAADPPTATPAPVETSRWPARAARAVARLAMPRGVRTRLYRRYRSRYEALFPERRVPAGGDGEGSLDRAA